MMKCFAILKDSLRESLDSKVLYVMIALSTLVILLVAALSFTPLPAEKTMERFFWVERKHPFKEGETREEPPMLGLMLAPKEKDKVDPLQMAMRLATLYPYRLVAVESLGDTDDSPTGQYALTIVRIVPKKSNKLPILPDEPEKRAEVVRGIFQEVEAGGYLHVEKVETIKVEDPDKETARFRVTVKGTPKTVRIWVTEPRWIFGAVPFPSAMNQPLALLLTGFSQIVIAIGSWVTVLVGIIITSFFFPNMLRKGTVDLLLVKPVQRWVLLLAKYFGGLIFVFLCTAYTMFGIWFALGIRSGLWPNGSLLLILTITLFFAILYAVSTFVGVLTRSTVTAIMVTLMAYAFLGTSGWTHLYLETQVKAEESREKLKGQLQFAVNAPEKNEEEAPAEGTRWADSFLVTASRFQQAISPRTEDLNSLNTLILYTDFMTGNPMDMAKFDSGERNWWVSFLVCLIWIAVFLGLASLWFTFKDY